MEKKDREVERLQAVVQTKGGKPGHTTVDTLTELMDAQRSRLESSYQGAKEENVLLKKRVQELLSLSSSVALTSHCSEDENAQHMQEAVMKLNLENCD